MKTNTKRSPRNEVLISNQTSKHKFNEQVLRRLTLQILAILKQKNVLLSLVFVSRKKMTVLNSRYLNHHWATDVLAFPFSFESKDELFLRGKVFLGEVIISPEEAQLNARVYKCSYHEEVYRYVCHGILHLLGYDDGNRFDQRKMVRVQEKLIALAGKKVNEIV